jgi:hypothetical protein
MTADHFVTDTSINYDYFHCCGDEDLYPFKCSRCGHVMVFCYECDTLYPNLLNLSQKHHPNAFDPKMPSHSCPSCGYLFEYYFMKNEEYKVTVHEWAQAGFQHLLLLNNHSNNEEKP